jgi:hypothetical protein
VSGKSLTMVMLGRSLALERSIEKACADLDLDADDIAILRVDRAELGRHIARALGLSPHQPGRGTPRTVTRIGTHDVFAGRGFQVFFALPGPSTDADPRPFAEILNTPGPRLLLTPTAASLPDALIAALDRAGATRMALADIVIAENGALPAHTARHRPRACSGCAGQVGAVQSRSARRSGQL